MDNVKSLANLAMLCGNVVVRGGGVNPLRGQNNVQGACDMGGLPNVYTGYQKVDDSGVRGRMAKAWGVAELPDKPGLTATDMMTRAHDGRLKAMYVIGENPMLSDPDLNHAQQSLEKLAFLVVQDLFESTLAAAAAGAEVVHVVAARNVVAWARRNAALSGMADAPIRWITEYAVKFVRRELRRQSEYDAVILAPPSYGHGPQGEVWRLSRDLPRLNLPRKRLPSNLHLHLRYQKCRSPPPQRSPRPASGWPKHP